MMSLNLLGIILFKQGTAVKAIYVTERLRFFLTTSRWDLEEYLLGIVLRAAHSVN